MTSWYHIEQTLVPGGSIRALQVVPKSSTMCYSGYTFLKIRSKILSWKMHGGVLPPPLRVRQGHQNTIAGYRGKPNNFLSIGFPDLAGSVVRTCSINPSVPEEASR